jgi:hypothetical protein
MEKARKALLLGSLAVAGLASVAWTVFLTYELARFVYEVV